MITKVQKWGNSQGVRLTRQMLDQAQLATGDSVEISVRAGTIIVEPVRRVRGRYRLEDLVAEGGKPSKTKEISWGDPAGSEDW